MALFEALGCSGLKAPRLWPGAMMFGDQTQESEARDIVAAAKQAGLTAIDTSDNYASGESERMVGRLIADERSRWIVATKVANPMSPDPNERGLSRRWVLQEVDNSLRRLGTDWIDLYYMHRDDEQTPIEETLSTFARLIETGKIRHYGVSNFRGWRVARVIETARRVGIPQPVACQPPYSAVRLARWTRRQAHFADRVSAQSLAAACALKEKEQAALQAIGRKALDRTWIDAALRSGGCEFSDPSAVDASSPLTGT